jgi:molybdate-binding protein
VKEGRRRTSFDHAAAMEHDNIACNTPGLSKIMCRHHDLDPAFGNSAHNVLNCFGCGGIEACSGLIEKEYGRIARKKLSDIASVAKRRVRMVQRPAGAGAHLLFVALLARAGIALDQVSLVKPVCATGPDIAQAVRSGRADCGIATRSVAASAGLDFVSLTWERFDLVMRQRDYFLPGPKALFRFLRSSAFRVRADELGGYDSNVLGDVRLVN